VVNNFRSKDVALGGQGAPLVPLGERYLFSKYDMCLNLGGIANISFNDHEEGFDIGPCNLLLNYLIHKHDVNMEFDMDGEVASSGTINKDVLGRLTALEFYSKPSPKSLGREWFDEEVKPLMDFKVK